MKELSYRGWIERLAVIALIVAACVTMAPLVPWLLLSLWVAALGKPLLKRIKRTVGGSERAAGMLVILLIIIVVTPLVVIVASLSKDAIDLARRLLESEGGKAALEALVSGGKPDADHGETFEPGRLIQLAQEHGARAWSVLITVAGAAADLLIGLFIFFVGTYVVLVDGDKAYSWFLETAPLRPAVISRFRIAFLQTGRGLFIGTGLTGVVQATIATVTYFILGVPNALVLGLLTLFASILPSIGTALIWVPVAAGLALTDRTGAAIGMIVVGLGVIGVVDNVLRPYLAHWADNHLPTFAVMVGMFGGIGVFGGWGILIGPLLLRLGMDALAIARDTRPPADVPPAVLP